MSSTGSRHLPRLHRQELRLWRDLCLSKPPCAHRLELASDTDGDGQLDPCDNCINVSNSSQDDQDSDGVGDACDNCVAIWNPTQSCPTTPSVTVTYPNGGETLYIGSSATITWTASDACGVASVDILLSRDNA